MKKKLYFISLMLLITSNFIGCNNNISTNKQIESPPSETTAPAKNYDSKVSKDISSHNYSYFDDAVFVGDSVSLKLSYYVNSMRKTDPNFMGKAKFLVSGSLGSKNALWTISDTSVHPSYKGKKMLIEDAISKMDVKKVFIMLGINDVAICGASGSVKNFSLLIDNIKAKSPNVEFYIQSATPIAKGCEKGDLTNKNIDLYNKELKKFAESNGYKFLDIASCLKDNQGFLNKDYCSDPSDMGVHFKDNACKIWTDALLNNSHN